MRFCKGSKVEVLTRKDAPSGAWRVGEIVSGNGHTYSVSHGCPWGMSSEHVVVERVSRKDLRPCPPVVDDQACWSAGDLVEVFDDMSWKTAVVLNLLSGSCYLVRIVGSSRELRLNKASIRVRQLWQDGKWIVLGKGCANYEDLRSNKLPALSCYRKMSSPVPQTVSKTMVQSEENCLAAEGNAGFQEFCVVSARTLKRRSIFGPSDVKAGNGKALKIRAIEKEDKHQRYPFLFLSKVDAVAYPQEYLGERNMHATPKNHDIWFDKSERATPGHYVESFHARSLVPDDTNSNACSVGSCSVISDRPCEPRSHMLAGNYPDADALSSDAESFYGHGDEEESSSAMFGEDVAARIHRLEMHAYYSTLVALYASGPLSWEQEAFLTNLRISLNISNDEHLMQLKNLISSGSRSSIHFS